MFLDLSGKLYTPLWAGENFMAVLDISNKPCKHGNIDKSSTQAISREDYHNKFNTCLLQLALLLYNDKYERHKGSWFSSH